MFLIECVGNAEEGLRGTKQESLLLAETYLVGEWGKKDFLLHISTIWQGILLFLNGLTLVTHIAL